MVDIGLLANTAGLTLANLANYFTFKTGNNSSPGGWIAAPGVSSVLVRAGAGLGGSTRVTLTWTDGAIRNTWLQVTVLANASTGLGSTDVFYFGNQIAASGATSAGAALVDAASVTATRANPHGPFGRAAVDDPYDYNRDRLVNATDIILARDNQTSPATALQLVTVPWASGAGPSMVVAAADSAAGAEGTAVPSVGHVATLGAARERASVFDGARALATLASFPARQLIHAWDGPSSPAAVLGWPAGTGVPSLILLPAARADANGEDTSGGAALLAVSAFPAASAELLPALDALPGFDMLEKLGLSVA